MMAEEKQGPSKFYGIAGGLDGFNGVAVDWWTQAHILTNRVPNCRHKRFSSEAAAKQYVSQHTGIPVDEIRVLAEAQTNFEPPSGSETEEETEGKVAAAAPSPQKEEPVWPCEEWLEILEQGGRGFVVEDGRWSDGQESFSFEEFCELFSVSLEESPRAWERIFDLFHKGAGGQDEQGQKEL